MPMLQDVGIIIRLQSLSETSLIVLWCTQKEGLIKTVARGARSQKGSFKGELDLFFESRIQWKRRDLSDLHILTEAELLDAKLGIRQSYSSLLVAGYFSALLEKCVEPQTPIEEWFNLLKRGIDYLKANSPTKQAIKHFEWEVAKLLGVSRNQGSGYQDLLEAIEYFPITKRENCLKELVV